MVSHLKTHRQAVNMGLTLKSFMSRDIKIVQIMTSCNTFCFSLTLLYRMSYFAKIPINLCVMNSNLTSFANICSFLLPPSSFFLSHFSNFAFQSLAESKIWSNSYSSLILYRFCIRWEKSTDWPNEHEDSLFKQHIPGSLC